MNESKCGVSLSFFRPSDASLIDYNYEVNKEISSILSANSCWRVPHIENIDVGVCVVSKLKFMYVLVIVCLIE
jgi:hypothetical protein